MPQIDTPESRNYLAPGIRFLRIRCQMRMSPSPEAGPPVRSLRLSRSLRKVSNRRSRNPIDPPRRWGYGGLESLKWTQPGPHSSLTTPGFANRCVLCLEADEARVITVGTSAGALEALDRSWFDVVFLDLWLQSESGLTVLPEILRRQFRRQQGDCSRVRASCWLTLEERRNHRRPNCHHQTRGSGYR